MGQHQQPVAILSLGTAVPAYQAQQTTISQWMADSFASQPALARWLRSIYAHSGIETRYACIPDFIHAASLSRFAPGQPPADTPSTAERMAIYEREAAPLGELAARRALAGYAQMAQVDLPVATSRVTHLVVVSCTGFFAPGLDLALARRLNLNSTVERTLIGFMGCAAAFNGLRTAAQIVRGQPAALVLVVCVELCSIHIQPGTERENLISASLFADGASACLVGTAAARSDDIFEIEGFHTRVKPDTESQMVWQIGNHGFVLRLSPQIPDHLAETAPAALGVLFDQRSPPQFWAIHPGGRAIVDGLSDIFGLAPEQIAASQLVLRRFGNLSSATIFFVLEELRQRWRQHPAASEKLTGVAMAFGPGLVMEMARLAYIPPALSPANGKIMMSQVETLRHGKIA